MVKSNVCFDTKPGIGGAGNGHCWVDWQSINHDTEIRYWSVHKIAVAAGLMPDDVADEWADMAVVCFIPLCLLLVFIFYFHTSSL